MKKLLTILLILISYISYGQEFDFLTRGNFYKRMSVYDSTAVANSIAAKADNLANFYLKDSSLANARIVNLNDFPLTFSNNGNVFINIDPSSGSENIRVGSTNLTGGSNGAIFTGVTSNTEASFNIGANFDGLSKIAVINAIANGSSAIITHTAESHIFNGINGNALLNIKSNTNNGQAIILDVQGGTLSGETSLGVYSNDDDGYGFNLQSNDGTNTVSIYSTGSVNTINYNALTHSFISGTNSFYFKQDSLSLDNGSISPMLLINSGAGTEKSFIGAVSSETFTASSYFTAYSNSVEGYRFYNYASDGSNYVSIIGNAATQTLEFKGKMILQTVTSGAATDSVLTQDASTGQIYRRAASSFGNAGTVTNVAALTLGTTGTDLSSSVANSTTTPVITLNVPTSSASNRGVLSSTDWSTFNSKESALSFTLGLNRTVNTVKVDTADASILSRQRAALTYAPISITGTVTSVATGLGLSGGTITTSGTLLVDTSSASILSRQRAAATYLTIANSDTSKTNIYTALAGKQTALSGTGLLSFSGTTPSYNTTSASISAIISDETGSGSMVFGTTPTFTTSAIVPLLLGGTGTTSTLTLQTTSGVGATNADMIFKVGNNGATQAMRILNTGWVNFGPSNPTNIFSVNPLQYATGTASQSTTAVVGSGTTFTAAMVGSQFVYADGTNSGTITAFTDGTHITVATSQTVASQAFTISYTGLQVSTGGAAGFGILVPQAKFHAHNPDGLTYPLGVSGTSKGIRFLQGSSYMTIQGVDNTLSGSYQTMALGGNTLRFETAGQTLAAQIDASQRMSIGASTTPSAYLTLRNGIATAGFAPLKLTITSAIINTVAERGAIEVASNRLYYTDSTATRYIIHAGGTPTIAAGTGAGGSPTISITGIDEDGYVTLTTGTLPTLSATVATVTFSSAYGATPKCVILTAANANAAALNGLTMVYVDQAVISTTTWAITAGATALTAATAYKWYYRILQ